MVLPNVLPSLYLNRASLMGEIAECLYSAIDNLNYEWQYYIDPVSGKKFRSSKEVLHYLETGTKRKPSDSPGGSQKQKKSSPMPKKAPPFYFDFENPPQSVSWVQTNAPGDAWTPYSCHGMVPECIRNEWSTVFSSVTQVVGQKNAPLKDKKSSS
nr:methyl-CpG-binding domain-containing protein 5-like [Ipomoea batatas]